MNKNYTTHHRFKAFIFLCILLVSSTYSYSQGDDFDRIQKVVASDRALYDQFGSSVAINGDIAAIGSPRSSLDINGLNEVINAGAVYIYERNTSGSWILVQKITAPVRRVGNYFGQDLEISGQTLIVGSPNDDYDTNESNFLSEAGSAFIFVKNVSGVWNFTQKITPTIRTTNDYFGSKVSISNDRAIVNAPYNGTDASNANPMSATGAVFAFEKNVSGVWNQVLKIVEPVRFDNNMFGSDLDISDNYFLIGSPHNTTDASNVNYISDAGAVYAYQWGPSGISFFQKIVANDRKFSGLFGTSVAIEASYTAIGARGESADENNLNPVNFAGAIYAYNLGISPFVGFHFFDKMVAPDRSSDTQLGYSTVDIKSGYIIASSYNSFDNTMTFSNFLQQCGSAYIFKLAAGYEFHKKLVSTSRNEYDHFGFSVAFGTNPDGIVAVVGSTYDDQDQNEQNVIDDAGSTFVFGACVHSSSSINVTSCNNYDFHGNFYNTTGTYVDTIPNEIGCDSIVTINLTILAIDTTLSYTNGTLTANQSNATYQWINCQTGNDVVGETNQSFTPSSNGMYKVQITPNTFSCTVESSCAIINNAGINENKDLHFSIFPNPCTNAFTIQGKDQIESIQLFNLNGELVKSNTVFNSSTSKIEVSDLEKGFYFLHVKAINQLTEIVKIVIQ